jgi:membrane dipeptidase
VQRRNLLAYLTLSAATPLVPAQSPIPIADAHNHLGLLRKNTDSVPRLATLMRESGVHLLSWTIVPDAPFLRTTASGIEQARPIRAGELLASYERQISNATAAIRGNVTIVRTLEDLAKAGTEPCIVLTTEGADFLEGSLDGLAPAHAQGIRHLQLVHYVQNPVGDLQTERPMHGGLSDFGKRLVRALNDQGMLVDLAHSSGNAIDQALEISRVPVIWSHGFVTGSEPSWTVGGWRARGLALAHARKIAGKGGSIGLWGLGSSFGGGGLDGYASEIIRMVSLLGPEHVMFGSDEDGLPSGAVIDQLLDLRKVVDILARRGVEERVLRAVAFGNYQRCLRLAMEGRRV